MFKCSIKKSFIFLLKPFCCKKQQKKVPDQFCCFSQETGSNVGLGTTFHWDFLITSILEPIYLVKIHRPNFCQLHTPQKTSRFDHFKAKNRSNFMHRKIILQQLKSYYSAVVAILNFIFVCRQSKEKANILLLIL